MKLFLILLTICFLSKSYADKWVVNKDHSEIKFNISYLLVSHVSGQFLDFTGSLDYDDETDIFKNIELIIQSQSVFTANKMRDTHLKKSDFFDVKKYPKIKFVSNKVEAIDDYHFKVFGKLTLRGKTFDEVFDLKKSKILRDTWNKESLFFDFKTKFNIKKYGFVWNKSLVGDDLLIGEDVIIKGVIQAQEASKLTRGSKHRIPDTKEIRLREKVSRGEISEEELEKQARTKPSLEVVPKKDKLISKNLAEDQEGQQDYEEGLIMITAFTFLAFMGFLANLYLCIGIKKKTNDYFKEKYEEIGLWGYVTDILVFIISSFYVAATYTVGMAIL